jgi:hypothetical protein
VELLERDAERAVLAAAIEDSPTAGRVVVVVGEAGIGKTALVAAVCDALPARRVLWGACDPLITPRPLGPLRDVARAAGGALAAAVEEGAREAVLAAALDELATGSVLVVEDLHWADDATLDLVALLGRRLVRAPGCLVVTCRPDALSRRPEVARVLGALPRECVRRLAPEALSAGAVAVLARRAGREPADLHAVSGGNPFYVTEALAAPGGSGLPASVRDAMALRVALLTPPARAVLELAAMVPGPTELWLCEATLGAGAAAIDECIEAGLLGVRGDALAFRHDLARRAVAEGIAPIRRRELDRLVLGSPTTPGARATPRRSAGSRPSRRGRRPRPAGTARRSSTGRRRCSPSRAPIRGRARRRSTGSASRRTCAGARSARSRRAARCSRSTRRPATRCARATTYAGCRASCGGRDAGRRRPSSATARSRRSRRSPRAASWPWR